MGIIFDFLMLLFLMFITISIIGLVWCFMKKKPMKKWTVRLIINLLLLIATTVLNNSYLLAQERKENTANFQEIRQASKSQNEKNKESQNYVIRQINWLEQNVAAKTNQEYLNAAKANLKMNLDSLKEKIDYLIKSFSNSAKFHYQSLSRHQIEPRG